MRILILIHRYPPALGGSERYVQEMACRLADDGHEVTVFTSDILDIEGFWRRRRQRVVGVHDDGRVVVRRFRARVLPLHGIVSRLLGLVPWPAIGLTMAPPGLALPGMWHAVRNVKRLDLVYASAYPSIMYLGAVAARRSGARLVLMPCLHPDAANSSPGRSSFLTDWMVDLYQQADAVIALTKRERNALISAGVGADAIHVTGAGVDPDSAAAGDPQRFLQRYGLPRDGPIISFIGHKTIGKGALVLLRAGMSLIDRHPQIVVALVGMSSEAFAKAYASMPVRARQRILNLELSEPEKQDLLAATSVLVLPSRDDAFGIVLLEAWLHGKPVIGARAGGIPDVISDQQTGLLVPYGDAPSLASAITWLLDHPQETERMGARGKEETLRKWTWQAVYDRFWAACTEALGGGGQPGGEH